MPSASGEPVRSKLPADRDGEHLLADDREQAAREVKPEVAVPKKGIRTLVGGWSRRLVGQIFQ